MTDGDGPLSASRAFALEITPVNDAPVAADDVVELSRSEFLIAALGQDVMQTLPVTSTKGMHGHLLGTARGIELAAVLVGMQGGFIPPNVGMFHQDPAIALHIPTQAEPAQIDVALSASFAFGGHNSVLAVGRE